jgi:TRAP-type C4-dicarboxylate transport system substrate-binding protein
MTNLIRRNRRIAVRPRWSVIRPRDAGFNPEGPLHRDKSTCRQQIAMTRSILLNCVEPFLPAIDITMGDEVPVYSRASLSRTAATVAALFLTATASAAAREFRDADTRNEDYPTVQAPRYMSRMIAEHSGGRHGLRPRVQQSELMSDMSRAPGADPVELPYGQVLTGLATRPIDGAENRHAGYYTLTEHTMSPEVLVIWQKAWAGLSAEDREIFREEPLRFSDCMRANWRDIDERSRKQAELAGVTIVADFDRKPFEALMAGIYAKAQRDPAAAQLIERIRKVEQS